MVTHFPLAQRHDQRCRQSRPTSYAIKVWPPPDALAGRGKENMCINTNKQYSTAERLLAVMRKEKERLGVPWYEVERKAGVGSYVTRIWLAGQCMHTI